MIWKWPIIGMIFLVGFYLPSGDKWDKTVGRNPDRQPYEVVQNVKLVAGVGRVILNSRFTTEKGNVSPTSNGNIFPSVTQILEDTSRTVRYYAVYISTNMETVVVKSSSTADTSNVRLRLLMK